MAETDGRSRMTNALVALAAFVIIVAGMRAASSLLVPFLLAVFIAIIAGPPLYWMQQKGIPGPVAIVILVATIAVAGVALVAFVGSAVTSFSAKLPSYQERMTTELKGAIDWLDRIGVEIPEDPLQQYLDPGMAARLFGTLLNSLAATLSNAFVILLTVVFILIEASSFPEKLARAMGGSTATLSSMSTLVADIRRYMAIKTAVSLLTGFLVTVWLTILGVDYAILWGLLAFLFNYVPNIGSFIAAVPAVVLAFIQLGIGSALWTAVGFIAVNVVIGNVIEPRVMGRGLGLSTLVVFVSLVFWGWVFGPVGMFLSTVLIMITKIVLESSEETRWAAILLGPSSAEATVDRGSET